jgi:hypothetical protein
MSETFPMLNGSGGNEIRDGYALILDRPGTGLTWNVAAIKRLLVT